VTAVVFLHSFSRCRRSSVLHPFAPIHTRGSISRETGQPHSASSPWSPDGVAGYPPSTRHPHWRVEFLRDRFNHSLSLRAQRDFRVGSNTLLQKALVNGHSGGTGTGVQTGKVHHLTGVQIGKVRDLSEALFLKLPRSGKNLKHDQTRKLIRELCAWKPFGANELSELLGRSEKYLLRKHLNPIIEAKALEYTLPNMINHPQQAYRTSDGRKEGGDR